MFFAVIFSFCAVIKAQKNENKNYTLEVKVIQDITLHGCFFWRNVIVKDDSICKSIKINSDSKVIFTDLRDGKYTVNVVSHFNQIISKNITVNKNSTIIIKTKQKLKKIKTTSLLSRIKNSDTLQIIHNVTGGSIEREELKLIREKNIYHLLKYSNGEFVSKKQMSKEDFEFITQIEKELVSNNFSSGCSVIETYTFHLNGKYFSVNDNGCNWNGFSKLLNRFFNN